MPQVRITNEMIERAAQAIQLAVSNRSRLGRTWQQIPQALRKSFRTEAEAALTAALREDANA